MNFIQGAGRDLAEIAALLIGVAFVGMLITNAQGTAAVTNAISQGFSGVLATATFQRNNYGNVFNPL